VSAHLAGLGPFAALVAAIAALIALTIALETFMRTKTERRRARIAAAYNDARAARRERGHEPLFEDSAFPNAIAYSYWLEHGTKITLYRSTPGDTAPRMQMTLQNGQYVNAGFVDNPERFGDHGTTRDEFRQWCQRFADHDLSHQP
jgi:hypothetical protein